MSEESKFNFSEDKLAEDQNIEKEKSVEEKKEAVKQHLVLIRTANFGS